MLHLAWCLADSAAMKRWRTGNQTILWGSCFIQLRKCKASMNSLLLELAFSKQDLTDGSTLEPPKEASSPKTRGIWMQSCKRSPSLRSVARRCWSAMSLNMSVEHRGKIHKRTRMLLLLLCCWKSKVVIKSLWVAFQNFGNLWCSTFCLEHNFQSLDFRSYVKDQKHKKVWNISNYKREQKLKVWKSKNFENLRIL